MVSGVGSISKQIIIPANMRANFTGGRLTLKQYKFDIIMLGDNVCSNKILLLDKYCRSGNFHEFLILGLFTKFRIREYSFFISAIIIRFFARFLNFQICPLHKK